MSRGKPTIASKCVKMLFLWFGTYMESVSWAKFQPYPYENMTWDQFQVSFQAHVVLINSVLGSTFKSIWKPGSIRTAQTLHNFSQAFQTSRSLSMIGSGFYAMSQFAQYVRFCTNCDIAQTALSIIEICLRKAGKNYHKNYTRPLESVSLANVMYEIVLISLESQHFLKDKYIFGMSPSRRLKNIRILMASLSSVLQWALVNSLTITRYTRGAWLMSHLDRLQTHVISAILNIKQVQFFWNNFFLWKCGIHYNNQDVEEDWPLQIFDHQGVAHDITLKPGEMIW